MELVHVGLGAAAALRRAGSRARGHGDRARLDHGRVLGPGRVRRGPAGRELSGKPRAPGRAAGGTVDDVGPSETGTVTRDAREEDRPWPWSSIDSDCPRRRTTA